MTKVSRNDFEQQVYKMFLEFCEGTRERCEEITNDLIALESSFSNEVFERIVRQVHSIKGAGATYGVSPLTTLAHNFENEFNSLDSLEDAQKFVAIIDLMTRIVDIAVDDHKNTQEKELLYQSVMAELYSSQSGKCKILVADNSRTFALYIGAALENVPSEIEYHNNGLDALSRVMLDQFQFAFFGQHLTHLSGLACIAAIKHDHTANTPVCVLMTSGEKRITSSPLEPDFILMKNKNFKESVSEIFAKAAQFEQK